MASAIVTSLTWVRRNVAKHIPDKLELSKDELKALVEDSQRSLSNLMLGDDDDDDNDDEEEVGDQEPDGEMDAATRTAGSADGESQEDMEEAGADGDADLAEYGLDKYDQEPEVSDVLGSGFRNFATFTDNDDDPYISIKDDEEDDIDREDINIKPSDNMIVIGKAEEDFCNLEVYVFNETEGVLYVHHDILLSSFPLALEWLNFDPMEAQPGNLVAIGNMTPVIEVWDLDIINSVEPAYTLGKKVKKKSRKTPVASLGHSDAVLDLSWNYQLGHGLASASADHTVLLWDLGQGKAVSALRRHSDKVQTIEWHPFELQSLLSGGFDERVTVCDCRTDDSFRTWSVDGEVERVMWHHYQPFNFLASTEKGFVYNFDIRADKPLFRLHAHEKAVTGVSLSPTIPDLLVTCSADASYKVWDIQDNKPALIVSKDPKMGVINNAVFCPDSPFLVAMGGERDSLRLMDLAQHAPVTKRFEDRRKEPVIPHPSEVTYAQPAACSQGGDEEDDVEESVTPSVASGTSSASSSSAARKSKHKKRKKKKKSSQQPSSLE
ncbi:periodic tryptophan protein 1 homolog [Diadema antillarum]|uniref:periodic tryptophan protein 1 homolog n=1 Tax=Diadema antillarum TaxID=105358 RepID=UPI003A83A311